MMYITVLRPTHPHFDACHILGQNPPAQVGGATIKQTWEEYKDFKTIQHAYQGGLLELNSPHVIHNFLSNLHNGDYLLM